MSNSFSRKLVEESTKLFNYDHYPGNKNLTECTDKSKDLDLFCYNQCNNDEEQFIKECRGVVFNNDTLIMKAFPFTNEYTVDEFKKLNIDNFESYKIYDSHEGTLIRLFYFNDRWFISTHKKLDAFRSRWCGRTSFGDIFKNGLIEYFNLNKEMSIKHNFNNENIFSFLDTSKQYMFLINSNENRIVCKPEYNTIYHVGTYINGELNLNDDIGVIKPTKHDFENINDLCNYVNHIDPFKIQGVIVFTKNNTHFKIFNDRYKFFSSLRNNEPSIKYRYLQLRNTDKIDSFHKLYPEYKNDFVDYERIIHEITYYIHKSYVNRFVHKQNVVVSQNEYNVVKECHKWHCIDRKKNIVTLNKVKEIFNKQYPSSINHMIKDYIEKSKKNI